MVVFPSRSSHPWPPIATVARQHLECIEPRLCQVMLLLWLSSIHAIFPPFPPPPLTRVWTWVSTATTEPGESHYPQPLSPCPNEEPGFSSLHQQWESKEICDSKTAPSSESTLAWYLLVHMHRNTGPILPMCYARKCFCRI